MKIEQIFVADDNCLIDELNESRLREMTLNYNCITSLTVLRGSDYLIRC